jgi:hypothetical protein
MALCRSVKALNTRTLFVPYAGNKSILEDVTLNKLECSKQAILALNILAWYYEIRLISLKKSKGNRKVSLFEAGLVMRDKDRMSYLYCQGKGEIL